MSGEVRSTLAAGIVILTLAAACSYDGGSPTDPGSGDPALIGAVRAESRVITASGDLTQSLASFRAALGDSVNRLPGEQAGGRREINWDGVAATLVNSDTFPGDFFNRVVPRGQIFTTEGTGFRVSDNALGDLNPAYQLQFGAFSPTRIFVAAGSNALKVHFVVAGSATPALVNGFGVVFSDVDRRHGTTLAFFDARGRLLRRVAAPVRSDAAGFSFVGVTFSTPVVASVRIVSGQAAITGDNEDVSDYGRADLVAMDDFIAGEPHAIR
jgi:hypothetical protein